MSSVTEVEEFNLQVQEHVAKGIFLNYNLHLQV